MSFTLTYTIKQILDILSHNNNINFNHPNLPVITRNSIQTTIGNILPVLIKHPSPLSDKIPDLHMLENITQQLNERQSIVGVDHVGFCYKVDSNEQEKIRIINLAKKKSVNLYQEPSNDDGLWLFAGDLSNIRNPVIELVPIEKTIDPDQQYWLPHIQIDINTTLDSQDIINLIRSVYGDNLIPIPFIIDGNTYIIRSRIGIVEGINIFLDLATNSRDVVFLRQKIWKKIT